MNELQVFAGDTPPLPESKAQTWQLIGRAKAAMDDGLQKRELVISSTLTGFDKMPLKDLVDALVKYRAQHGEMVDFRKKFTKHLDDCVTRCMAVEKKYDPKANPDFIAANKRQIELRDAEQKKQDATLLKANEAANLKAHITNQYHILVTAYAHELDKIIHQAHKDSLTARMAPDGVPKVIEIAKSAMLAVKLPPVVKFECAYHTAEEKVVISKTVPQPKLQEYFNQKVAALNEKFSMYANDLEAADKVIELEDLNFSANTAQQQADLIQQTAATSLAASATVVIEQTPGFKPLTTASKIVVQTDSQEFVITIMKEFLKNFQKCIMFVRVKDYSRLTILQMCSALDQAGIEIAGVKYETTQK